MRSIQGANVCVVGGAGFIGSHVVNHLVEDRDCSVLVLDNLAVGRKRFIHEDAKFVYCDITDSESYLRKLFEQHDIEYVLNYAAEPYIPVSFDRPLHVFDLNAFGALQVINAAQDAGCTGVLQVSSAEIYGDQDGKINEDAPVRPHSSYGASKAAIDFLVQARWKEAKTPCIALRQFNCVGERETHPYVIPEIISQIHTNGPYLALGNNSVRDFQYAGDAARMAVELLEKGQFGEVYNMGSQETIGIFDLARKIGKLMGHDDVEITQVSHRMRPWEIWHLQSDNTKLYGVIDARPDTSLDDALTATIEYFYDNGCRWDW